MTMKNMTRKIFSSFVTICVVLITPGATVNDDFIIRCQVDFSNVAANEPLYEVGPVRLAFRMAGQTKELEQYDNRSGNYLNFPLPDGSCPVIEATMHGLRVGIPLGFLKRRDGVHNVRLIYAKTHFSIEVEGHLDDDMFRTPTIEADLSTPKALSSRVKSANISVLAGAPGGVNFSRPVEKPIQYWTPPDHNAWVGDVSPGVHGGRLHVFYLFDRRHHASKGGAGGHYYAHVASPTVSIRNASRKIRSIRSAARTPNRRMASISSSRGRSSPTRRIPASTTTPAADSSSSPATAE